MKNKICILMISFLIISLGLFSTCGDSEETVVKAITCTVTFNPNGGTFVGGARILTIVVGRDAPMGGQYPTPDKEDYDFCGWFDAGNMRYRPDTPVNADITLTARWLTPDPANYWTVTFETGAGVSVGSIQVVRGEPMGYKYPLTWRFGYNFDGWFNGATQYGITTPINGNITLTAHWSEKVMWDVTFDSGTGNHFEGSLSSTIGTYGEGGHPASPGIPEDPGSPNRTFTIKVYDGEGIWDRIPTTADKDKDPDKDLLFNALSPDDDIFYYFWVQWVDGENRPYVESVFIPITENITLIPKWGAPDYIVPLRADPENPEKTPPVAFYAITPTDPPNHPASNPQFRVTENEDGTPRYTIWNVNENNSVNRWQMLYWIELNLPETFSIRYYSKYSVNAKFYGNIKATAAYRTVNFPTDTLIPNKDDYIQNAGDPMKQSRHGYGQLSFCISMTGTGEGSNGQTILQQYNLGMGQDGDGGSVNSTWKPSQPGHATRDPERPQVLLIQTSDDWIGRIEVTEIRFHNDPDFVAEQN
jgi:uncharacterized repeat protein (TIGR02543 family)